MPTISEALAIAVQHHQSGRLQAAEHIYRQILQVDPNQADAIHLIGVIASQVGRPEIAVQYIRQAIKLNGDSAAFHSNLGNALKDQGKLDEAADCYRQAVKLEPTFAEALGNLGNVLKAQGKLDEAVACYRRAVKIKPDFAMTHGNLGIALKEQGKIDEAIACYRRAAKLSPDFAEPRNNLGVALKEQGKLDEAIVCCRRAVQLKPDYFEAHTNLGIALKEQGNLDEAIACYRQALELNPNYAEAHNNLGNALGAQGKLDEAIPCYRRALELKPDFPEAYNNLGNALAAQIKLDEAVACYHRALQLKPDYVGAYGNLGNALKDQGRLDEAVACYRRALELNPEYAEAHANMGVVLSDQWNVDEAAASYRRALDLNPDYVEVHSNLCNVLRDQGNLNEAAAASRRALELKPDFVAAQNNLGNALRDQGMLDEAIACYRKALELKPDYVRAHSNLLATFNYRQGITPTELAEAHAEFDHLHAEPLRDTFAKHENVRDHQGPLRVGFVSGDLGLHPVGHFLVRALENLSREQHETICYSDRVVKDILTHRIQAAATQWRDVIALKDEQLAEQIRADRIDILFDLAGHTGSRLLVFARKPAPIQITWIGYEGTTGLSAMDYLLADRFMVPEESQQYYRERVLRMPDGYLCYDPPHSAPPVGPPPSLTKGFTTFGSFNNLAKITPEVVATWAKILHRLPTARLIVKYRGLGDPSVQRRYLDLFAAQEIEPQRLELQPWTSYEDYLATYHQVDLVLDPFPFSGSTTACEAMWMGVPVVTCPFETFASRHSFSHLSNLGLTETIAHDLDGYVDLAVSLAGDLPRLAALRAGLRERMAASPLCDGKRFAVNLMSLLREAWEQRTG